ncbi:DNA-binding protein [Burkholderia sp. 22PA0106]|uniref:helix-turn-helix domain-containing transcriptional regulator n=1 Tax=Burkholderia sp. 22PA0106 TaxID=3237371 RepID=UPI0039C449FE
MRSRPHDEAVAELYRSDPAFALEVINGILEDGNQAELLTVLRHIAQAFGGVPAILKAMGLRLAVQPPPSSPSVHAA